MDRRTNATQKSLLAWYARHGRVSLPWRVGRSPYHTLVSEFMLQQTQVDRVVPHFESFVRRFPDFTALANASVGAVVRAWKGLGYNSRAVRLKGVADAVVARHGGAMPSDCAALRALPGIGAYTAAAIRAFAFNVDDAAVDTNVARIVHRLLFGVEHPSRASAREVRARACALVPPGKAHDWNSALMDLGATLCSARAPKCLICPLRSTCVAAPIDSALLEHRRAASKAKASRVPVPFAKTTRYARGRIVDRLRELPPGERISLLDLHGSLAPLLPGRSVRDVGELVTSLEREGLVAGDGERFALRE
jgi:A/G-specific adenine glycosylase